LSAYPIKHLCKLDDNDDIKKDPFAALKIN
jgi:hypothetical protein